MAQLSVFRKALCTLLISFSWSHNADAAGPQSVSSIGIGGFSGSEAVVTFGGFDGPAESLTVDGVTFSDATEGLLVLQEGGAIPDALFGNIPSASKGGYGKTTASLLMKMLVELPSPARRFGMLISTGGQESYRLTAINQGVPLGSAISTQPERFQAVFAGIQAATPFQQVFIEQVSPGGMTSAFDDLRYELVPEPSSMSLLTMATAVFVARRSSAVWLCSRVRRGRY